MPKKRLSSSLAKDSNFVVVGELAAGPRFNFAPIERFLTGVKDADPDAVPKGYDFAGVLVPQNPGGVSGSAPRYRQLPSDG